MLLDIADRPDTKEEDIPETIVVISDMEIDYMVCDNDVWGKEHIHTEMDKVRQKWASHGHKLPRLVYWNVEGVRVVLSVRNSLDYSVLGSVDPYESAGKTFCRCSDE